MNSHDIVLLVCTLIGSTGVIGAIVAFYKLKPETGQILVSTAQGVVIMQTGVIESLREDLQEVRVTIKELRVELKQTKKDCDTEIAALTERLKAAGTW